MARSTSTTLLLDALRRAGSRRSRVSLADALATRSGDELLAMSENAMIDIRR